MSKSVIIVVLAIVFIYSCKSVKSSSQKNTKYISSIGSKLDLKFLHFDDLDKNDSTLYNNEEFTVTTRWAKNRMKNWCSQHDRDTSNCILMINKNNSFVIFNSTDLIKASARSGSNQYIIYLTFKPISTLENTFWREFMSGRLGRYVAKELIIERKKIVSEKELNKFINYLNKFNP